MNSIVIDTNLLVLLIVGFTDSALIKKHKRTRSFDVEDFEQLRNLVSKYDEIIVTPHILTETSNLIAQIADPALSAIRTKFSEFLSIPREELQSSSEAANHEFFIRLGLTDCAILSLIESDVPLITVDLDLYLAAVARNPNVLNFNHLRQAWLTTA